MQTMPKTVFSVFLLALLLSWAGSAACHARSPHRGRLARLAARVRLRRSGKDNPARCPFAPESQAVIPPDDGVDDVKRAQARRQLTPEGITDEPVLSPRQHSLPFFPHRQRMREEPLYQNLCVLLI
jgi:hypothetical protein